MFATDAFLLMPPPRALSSFVVSTTSGLCVFPPATSLAASSRNASATDSRQAAEQPDAVERADIGVRMSDLCILGRLHRCDVEIPVSPPSLPISSLDGEISRRDIARCRSTAEASPAFLGHMPVAAGVLPDLPAALQPGG